MQPVTKETLSFLLITFLLSALPIALLIYVGRTDIGLTVGALMWCPGLAAFLTCVLFKIKISTLGWRFYPLKYECIAYLLPIFYALPVYLVVWLTVSHSMDYATFTKSQSLLYGLPDCPQFATWAVSIPFIMTIGIIRSIAVALGEEIGWRGFLLPRLYVQMGYTRACFASGIIWAVWHYAGIFYYDQNGSTPKIEALICFTLTVISVSFILGYIRLKAQSIWPCAMLHASHNVVIQIIFNPMTAQTGKAVYFVGEYGVGLVVTTSILALWYWHKSAQLPKHKINKMLSVE